MERYYGLIEVVLVFGLLGWFYWSQMRALRHMREEDARRAEIEADDVAQAGDAARK